MKTLIMGLCLASAVLLFAGCKKENISTDRKQKPTVTATEKSIPNFDLTAGFSCGGQVCGSYDIIPNPKYNMLVMSNNAKHFTPVTYTLYERTYVGGGVEVYAPFDQFTCGLQVSNYASAAVNNNVKVLVIGTDAAFPPPNTTDNVVLIGGTLYPSVSNSSYQTVITGNNEGQICY
jgi:hypothetical protein